jgi:hypothetical protein
MKISDGLLVDNMAEVIPASWNGVESVAPSTSIPADATKSKSPGFGAVFAIGVLAAAYLVFKRD